MLENTTAIRRLHFCLHVDMLLSRNQTIFYPHHHTRKKHLRGQFFIGFNADESFRKVSGNEPYEHPLSVKSLLGSLEHLYV